MPGAKNVAILLGLLVVILLVVAPVSAKVVTYDGTGAAGTIQDVINNTSSGDSIFLSPGTYYGNFVIDRSIVFGGLDTNNPPKIISGTSGAGITLAADGITINGVVIDGNASYGLQVLSSNNRISSTTISGHEFGIGLKSASNNILSGNTLTGNSIGIDVDRSSRSNTFFLNTLNNTVDVVSQSVQNTWTSSRQDYQYNGQDFSGPLGNYLGRSLGDRQQRRWNWRYFLFPRPLTGGDPRCDRCNRFGAACEPSLGLHAYQVCIPRQCHPAW